MTGAATPCSDNLDLEMADVPSPPVITETIMVDYDEAVFGEETATYMEIDMAFDSF